MLEAEKATELFALQIENAQMHECTDALSSEFRYKTPQRSIPEPCHQPRISAGALTKAGAVLGSVGAGAAEHHVFVGKKEFVPTPASVAVTSVFDYFDGAVRHQPCHAIYSFLDASMSVYATDYEATSGQLMLNAGFPEFLRAIFCEFEFDDAAIVVAQHVHDALVGGSVSVELNHDYGTVSCDRVSNQTKNSRNGGTVLTAFEASLHVDDDKDGNVPISDSSRFHLFGLDMGFGLDASAGCGKSRTCRNH
jgi:hypothetical protein